MSEPRVLVTGATGFLGRALCRALLASGYAVRAAIRERSRAALLPEGIECCEVGEVDGRTDWRAATAGVETIVHLVSGMAPRRGSSSPLERYRETNVEGARSLAVSAARSGVARVVFVSTIKVNGEQTFEAPYSEADSPRPEDDYARSKWEAEQVLRELLNGARPALTVLRPPLVYGAEVRGNFLSILRALRRGVPLPLASVSNRRSLLYLGNLTHAIITCIASPAAAGRTYLVSDGEDVSTPDLIRRLGAALGVQPRLFPFPVSLLKLGGIALGRRAEMTRLTGSLQVDSALIRRELGWRPPFSIDEGFRETAQWFRKQGALKAEK